MRLHDRADAVTIPRLERKIPLPAVDQGELNQLCVIGRSSSRAQ
jgi:hypothetical protein